MVQWLSIRCARPRVGGPLLVGDEGPSCALARWPVGCVSPLRPNTAKSTSGFLRKKFGKNQKQKLQISFILSSHIIITTKLLNIKLLNVKKIKSECQKNTENDYGLVVELGVKTVFTIYFKHCKTIDTDAHGDIIIINVCDFFSLCGSYSNRNKCWNERKNTYFQETKRERVLGSCLLEVLEPRLSRV